MFQLVSEAAIDEKDFLQVLVQVLDLTFCSHRTRTWNEVEDGESLSLMGWPGASRQGLCLSPFFCLFHVTWWVPGNVFLSTSDLSHLRYD